MKITIRLAVPADAPDMAEIHMRSWEVAYKDMMSPDYIRSKNATRLELYKRVITDKNENAYVIAKDGETVGIMRVASPQDDDLGDDYCELHYLYLHPDFFRLGIGTKAVQFAFGKGRELGKKFMSVWVFADNENSIRFYEKCGFSADKKTKTEDCGKPKVCIRMTSNLVRNL